MLNNIYGVGKLLFAPAFMVRMKEQQLHFSAYYGVDVGWLCSFIFGIFTMCCSQFPSTHVLKHTLEICKWDLVSRCHTYVHIYLRDKTKNQTGPNGMEKSQLIYFNNVNLLEREGESCHNLLCSLSCVGKFRNANVRVKGVKAGGSL